MENNVVGSGSKVFYQSCYTNIIRDSPTINRKADETAKGGQEDFQVPESIFSALHVLGKQSKFNPYFYISLFNGGGKKITPQKKKNTFHCVPQKETLANI